MGYTYDDKTGEFKNTPNNNPPPPPSSPHSPPPRPDNDGCISGCVGTIFSLVLEFSIPGIIILLLAQMCS